MNENYLNLVGRFDVNNSEALRLVECSNCREKVEKHVVQICGNWGFVICNLCVKKNNNTENNFLMRLATTGIDYFRDEIKTLKEKLRDPNLDDIKRKFLGLELKRCEEAKSEQEKKLKRLNEIINTNFR